MKFFRKRSWNLLKFCLHYFDIDRINLNSNLSLFLLDGYVLIYNEGMFNKNDGTVAFLRLGFHSEQKIVSFAEDNKLLFIKVNFHPKMISILAGNTTLSKKYR